MGLINYFESLPGPLMAVLLVISVALFVVVLAVILIATNPPNEFKPLKDYERSPYKIEPPLTGDRELLKTYKGKK